MIHVIHHSFKPRILVPYIAITDNIPFTCNGKIKQEVRLSDGNTYEALLLETINILSDRGEKLIKEIYNLDTIQILKKWYKYDSHFESLEFVLIELKEKR